jgi:ATP-dependent DNA helicase RecG
MLPVLQPNTRPQKNLPENIGLIIVDEQHKFGVAQRSRLKEKGRVPHLLTMTATPIPRTVMLTLYGELDLSVIDQLPKNRLPIKSYVVPKNKRNDAYEWIRKIVVEKKQQSFIVCPLIEESESESMKNIKAASAEFDKLKASFFKDIKLGLLHGRMKAAEKETIMKSFNKGEIDVLVSTPVVEVGIDVPNATIIVIEAAERFGLSQLHQLRGRVGRGDAQSYCLLFTDNDNFPTQKRLHFFSKVQNGFELAEYDLKARGAGQLYGIQQHGENELKIAVLTDFDLVKKTHDAAKRFVEKKFSIEDYPFLKRQLETQEFRHIAKD